MPPPPFFGSVVMVIARRIGLHPTVAAVIGSVACFALRMLAVHCHWNLPKAT
jgi:uncharacterized membrane protein YeiH